MTRLPREPVDLRRLLPRGAQYALALAVVSAVVALAWHTGKDDPVPGWIMRYLVPILGWTYLALVAVALVHRLRSRWRGRR